MSVELPATLPSANPVLWVSRISDVPRDSHPIVVAGDNILTVSESKGLVCLNKWTGRELWAVAGSFLTFVAVEDVLVTSTYDVESRRTTYTALRLEDGSVLWTKTAPSTVLDTTMEANNLLMLVVSDKGEWGLDAWSLKSGDSTELPTGARLQSERPKHIHWDGAALWTAGDSIYRGDALMAKGPLGCFFLRHGSRVGVFSNNTAYVFDSGQPALVVKNVLQMPELGCGVLLINDARGLSVLDEATLEPRWNVKQFVGEELEFCTFIGTSVGFFQDQRYWFDLRSGAPIESEARIRHTTSTKDHTWWYQDGRVVLLKNKLEDELTEALIVETTPTPQKDARLPDRLDLPFEVGHSDFLIAVTQLNGNEVEGLRDHVNAENLSWLVDAYWKLNTWPMRAAMMELLQDQDREKIRPIADDLLRGPEMLGHQMQIAVAIVSGLTNREIMTSDELYERCYREWREAASR